MKIYSVTEINNYIKLLLMKDSVLNNVKISGEVSNCKYHTSGHIYFTLKDSDGQIACVMFAGKRTAGLNFRLEEGQNIIVTGSVAVYERDGKYQIYANRIEKQGVGKQFEEIEKLKIKLASEGLFDVSHKKPIPTYIKTLGVITASTGAAIHDIVTVTNRRNPYVKIVLYPAKVQGEGAAQTLIKGLHAMERIRPDVIILGRGGGSAEDLFEFNNEDLARAIYNCTIPVISAVGHEVDFSISDFVADLRAATPSAAAELAVYMFSEFESRLVDYHSEMLGAFINKLENYKNKTEKFKLRLNALSPENRINNYRFRLDKLSDYLSKNINERVINARHRLELDARRLDDVSPLKSLSRGYSYSTDNESKNITSVFQTDINDIINIDVIDGRIKASVTEIIPKENL